MVNAPFVLILAY